MEQQFALIGPLFDAPRKAERHRNADHPEKKWKYEVRKGPAVPFRMEQRRESGAAIAWVVDQDHRRNRRAAEGVQGHQTPYVTGYNMCQEMISLRLGFAIVLTITAANAQQNNDRHAIGVQASKIIATNCVGCHGGLIKNAGLDLRKRDTILKGGERGAAVSPGNPDLSRIYRQVAYLDGPHMPPGKKLSDEEINTLKVWIER